MTDIVQRLRTDVLWHTRRGNGTIAADCQEAADEIARLRAALAAPAVSEGRTPADAAMLRRANHALADEKHLLQTALADLHRQVQEFVATYGEADFYTGAALAVLAKTGWRDYRWPYPQSMADDAIAKLLAAVPTPQQEPKP